MQVFTSLENKFEFNQIILQWSQTDNEVTSSLVSFYSKNRLGTNNTIEKSILHSISKQSSYKLQQYPKPITYNIPNTLITLILEKVSF